MRRRFCSVHSRRSLRLLRLLLGLLGLLGLLVSFGVFLCLLPYDSALRLGVRFFAQRAIRTLAQPSRALEAWIRDDDYIVPNHVPRLYDDIGIVLKTGYGTRQRVSAQIEALGLRPHAADAANVLVVADFAGVVDYNATDGPAAVVVHDVIGPMLASSAIGPYTASVRGQTYRALAAAIHRGDDAEAQRISQSSGWSLDAMKLAWVAMPAKPWFLLLDDDTYVVPAALRLLLAHLDPDVPLYVGNAVGDFRVRFAHGGSAVVLSRAAVTALLARPAVVHQALLDGFTAVWGDKLLAAALLRVGVYLDERFTRLFNGARPRATRITADRFCLPLLGFHGLANPARMRDTGAVLDRAGQGGRSHAATNTTVTWGDLWALYAAPTTRSLRRQPLRPGRDFVGNPDEDASSSARHAVQFTAVASPEACRALCEDEDEGGDASRPGIHLLRGDRRCLAWTWHRAAQMCTTAPWLVVGEAERPSDKEAAVYSGVHVAHLEELMQHCQRERVAWVETEDAYRLTSETDRVT